MMQSLAAACLEVTLTPGGESNVIWLDTNAKLFE